MKKKDDLAKPDRTDELKAEIAALKAQIEVLAALSRCHSHCHCHNYHWYQHIYQPYSVAGPTWTYTANTATAAPMITTNWSSSGGN